MPEQPAEETDDLGLGEFEAPGDQGLSLDALSEAYAALIGSGEDPYRSATAADESLDEGSGESGEDAEPVVGKAAPDPTPRSGPLADDYELSPTRILEAMLFVGHPDNVPLSSSDVAGLMRGVRADEVAELVRELNEQYDEAHSAYQVVSVEAGYRLQLRPELERLRDKFYGRDRSARLTQATIDTLAIVAYNQPVTRERVDQLRGRPSAALLRQLVRRELLRLERQETRPRVTLYHTTERFLELFGLQSLEDLPRSHDLDRN